MNCNRPCGCFECARPTTSVMPRRAILSTLGAMTLAAVPRHRVRADEALSPDAALARLMAGNQRYVTGQMVSCSKDLSILRRQTTPMQQPFAAILSCSDSRVPVEMIFDQAIGDVFVARDAGNVAAPEITASLEYGVAVLGTAVVLVLGHEGCGAVKAAMAGEEVPGQISALYAPLRPAIERTGPDLVAVIKANARIQANLLSSASPVLSKRIVNGRLKLAAGYYSLTTGSVTLLS